ncbi:hypothetical protein [Gordonia phthalatica]|uniref:hypothetical protein n=1 Tax=Gordonia phthalatica TaxID=1136941 RepID=UPI0012FEE8BE|nr:hypothetical protein [Gordonia phthalatica]
MLNIDAPPSKIVIPGTDAPLTESPSSSLAPTTATRTLGDDEETASPWSYERVIKAAPRVSNSRFQIGATSASGERSDVSGYHFSNEDRTLRCSTGTNGADALVCVGTNVKGAKRPPKEGSACDWKADFVVLDANGPQEGACANSYPVLFRSRILSSGQSLSFGSFACLADNDDVYCIESSSSQGFVVTSAGFKAINAKDRAPQSLLGFSSETPSSTPNTSDSSPVVPTD